jgi:hypothetical protein
MAVRNERSTINKTATGPHKRLHDMEEHPEEAVESEGEQEPLAGRVTEVLERIAVPLSSVPCPRR